MCGSRLCHSIFEAAFTSTSALQNRDVDLEQNDHQITPGAWRNDMMLQDMQQVKGGNNATSEAKDVRNYLKHYYNNVGSVPWQDNMI